MTSCWSPFCTSGGHQAGGYEKLHMDVWSLEELEECRRLVYPDMDPSAVKGRWAVWGGVPRYVLQKVGKGAQQLITEAIDRSSIDLVRHALEGSAAHQNVSDLLLHTRVEADFVTTTMNWASDWVAEQFACRALSTERQKLVEFIGAAHDMPVMGTLRGRLWEGLCHNVLAAGGTFEVRRLDETSEGVQQLTVTPCASCLVFDDIREVEGVADDVYCRPSSQTFAAIDSLRQPQHLYQITVARRHDVTGRGLERAAGSLRARRAEIRLYFVVPPKEFSSLSNQRVKGKGGAGVVQYALKATWADVSQLH